MQKKIINSNDIYGNLKIIKEVDKKGSMRYFNVLCIKCGNNKNTALNSLIHSKTGCSCTRTRFKNRRKLYTTEKEIKLYNVFNSMKQRCSNKNVRSFKDYGGRGIQCIWVKFRDFYYDMGGTYENGLTIDRIDNDGNYCKENCKWVTNKENQRNKRNNIIIENITLPEFCEKYNLDYKQTFNRISRGYTVDELKENNNIIYKK